MPEITRSLHSFGNENNSQEPKLELEKDQPEVEQVKAHEMAKKQREISISEFFEKNRHLLGFDNKRKALLTTIKEAVDNSLDACDDAGILPEIEVSIYDMENDRFRLIIEDNGPGIVKKQIPKIFAKLLYGSKFHSLKQNRGQQGIGISASVMYGQLTTGRPAKITSKIGVNYPAHYYELHINTQNNKPEIIKDEEKEWSKNHGTRIEIDLEGSYIKGSQSVDEYLKQTAIINPHTTIIYANPKGEQIIFPRATDKHPKQSEEIKPHPHGVELGMLIKMLTWTKAKTIKQFLQTEFSRVGNKTANELLEEAAIIPKTKPQKISRELAERIMKAIKKIKIMAPPTNCISPIGAELLEKGLKKEVNAEFYTSVSRSPAVYRGNPFIIEAALAYGGHIPSEGSVQILRFANKVPLLYQQGACAITESIGKTSWRSYGLQQSGDNNPQGPCVILVHIASVWVPFTSEAKEAIAHYPEIIKEIKLALQEVGRNLYKYIAKKRRVKDELKKRDYIEKYIPAVAEALKEILNFSDIEEQNVIELLEEMLEQQRGAIDKMEFDENKNQEYDKDFADIGKEEQKNDEEEIEGKNNGSY
ncbi:MAG: DNA topoisomerase VI subunit B [Nanoarchaeota archaeon]|nr:DNA topoisomerase VI subunit B [Nanoarchaeota archaeon]MBU1031269.1 DNA topoisomerase VI subunit B [Nanoarchaeota archaeon]